MRGTIIKSILILLLVIVSWTSVLAKESPRVGSMSNLDRAIAFAVELEAHASRIENRTDVCVGFGDGLIADEKGILAELKRRNLKMHSNDWCNHGPRGLVISV